MLKLLNHPCSRHRIDPDEESETESSPSQEQPWCGWLDTMDGGANKKPSENSNFAGSKRPREKKPDTALGRDECKRLTTLGESFSIG